jgi:hypothetical protein
MGKSHKSLYKNTMGRYTIASERMLVNHNTGENVVAKASKALSRKIDDFYCCYNEIKREIFHADKLFYERWKAGGFLIDEDIMSMYPCLSVFYDNDNLDLDLSDLVTDEDEDDLDYDRE